MSRHAPIISVLIPVFNTAHWLRQCLDSVINQSLEAIEIIVVDDASTDNSGEICDEYAKKDNRINVVRKSRNEGTLMARKTAIELASGKYIVFVDSDDFLTANDSLAKQLHLIQTEDVDILNFSVNIFEDEEEESKPVKDYERYLRVNELSIRNHQNIINSTVFDGKITWPLWNKIYQAKICKAAAKNISETTHIVMAEDIFWFLAIASFAETYKAVKTPSLYSYRLGSGISTHQEVTLQFFEKSCSGEINAIRLLDAFYTQNNQKRNLQTVLDFLYLRCFNLAISNYFRLPENQLDEGFKILTTYHSTNDVLKALLKKNPHAEEIKSFRIWKYVKYRILSKIPFFKMRYTPKYLKMKQIYRLIKKGA